MPDKSQPSVARSKQRLRKVLLWVSPLLLLVISVILSWGILSILAHQQWEKTKRRLEANHYSLDVSRASFPDVLNSDNFFGSEVLRDIAREGKDISGTESARRRKLLLDLDIPLSIQELPRPSVSQSVEFGTPWIAEEWAKYLDDPDKVESTKASDRPADKVLEALRSRLPLIAKMEDAVRRPHSQITPLWSLREAQNGNDTRTPHLECLMAASRSVYLAAQAAAGIGEMDSAERKLAILIRFAEGTGNDPCLISGLVASTFARMALSPCWEILKSQGASQATLSNLAADLNRIDCAAVVHNALAGEIIWQGQLKIDPASNFRGEKKMMDQSLEGVANSAEKLAMNALTRINPDAYFRGEVAVAVECVSTYALEPLDSGGLMQCVESIRKGKIDVQMKRFATGIFGSGAEQTLDGVAGIVLRALYTEARYRQARIACALERYYAKGHGYPERLDQLVPEFLPEIPLDPIDNVPVRYMLTQSRYKLWCIGIDGRDDGGVIGLKTPDSQSQPSLTSDQYLGDWVWSYEPWTPTAPGR